MTKAARFIACTLIAFAAAGGTGSTAHAADKRVSLQLFGQLSKYADSPADGTIYAQIGYLLTDRVEVGISGLQSFSQGPDITGLGVSGKFYLRLPEAGKVWLPYTHLEVFRTSGDNFDADQVRGGVGMEIAVSESTSLLLEGAYSKQKAKVSGGGSASSSGSEVLLGVKVRF